MYVVHVHSRLHDIKFPSGSPHSPVKLFVSSPTALSVCSLRRVCQFSDSHNVNQGLRPMILLKILPAIQCSVLCAARNAEPGRPRDQESGALRPRSDRTRVLSTSATIKRSSTRAMRQERRPVICTVWHLTLFDILIACKNYSQNTSAKKIPSKVSSAVTFARQVLTLNPGKTSQ